MSALGPVAEAGARGADGTGRLLGWVLLGGFFLVSGAARGVYAAASAQPSPRFEILAQAGLMVIVWFWFVEQTAPHRPALPMDMGLLLAVFWMVLIPRYLWRYERWRGLGKSIAVGALYLCSWVASLVVWLVLR